MTVKGFFKSVTFKCIAALLSILLVCGILLTVAYAFLEVTASERADRAVAKIYSGIDVTRGDALLKDDESPAYGQATITQAYPVTYKDASGNEVKDFLVQATGKGGFSGGTVTCWVPVTVKEEDGDTVIAGVGNVSIDSNVNQSFIGNITDEFLASFGKKYAKDIYYSVEDGFVVSGTSRSSNAICNAVNGAMSFVDEVCLGHVKIDYFADFVNPQPDRLNKDRSSYAVEGGVVNYVIVTTGLGEAGPFTLNISVELAEGKPTIKSLEVKADGSTEDYGAKMADVVTMFTGKTLDYFTGLLGEDIAYPGDNKGTEISSGATKSNYNCAYACAFALMNYEKAVAAGGNA